MNDLTTSSSQTGQDILTFEPELLRASVGKRFANYLIDIVAFYLFAILIGIGIAALFPDAFASYTDSPGISLIDRLVSLVLYAIFMSVIEAVFKGKSLGKLITKTRAVNLDGSRISAGTAFARGFSRAVPFCAFSAFGTPCDPWQDRWTNTMVIEEKKSILG